MQMLDLSDGASEEARAKCDMNGPGLERPTFTDGKHREQAGEVRRDRKLSLASAEFAYSRDAAEEPSKPGL